jgi:predicted phage terminase large subunit-like protein
MGNMWDESMKMYPYIGSQTNLALLRHTFRSGAMVQFNHLQYESDVYSHKGDQLTTLLLDELTSFTEFQFWYMITRLRSVAGLSCRCYATTNPDATSWVRALIEWYLLPNGIADPKKAGKIRYLYHEDDGITHWASTREELARRCEIPVEWVRSFAFIPATIEDNQILLQSDPSYVGRLSPSRIERERLLHGNWNVKTEGKIFKQEEFRSFVIEPKFKLKIITIDTASKTKEASDYSVLQCWGLGEQGIYLIAQLRGKWKLPELELMAIAFAEQFRDALIFIEDIGAGTALIQRLERLIKRPIMPITRTRDKFSRAYECQAWVEQSYVFLNPTADYYLPFIGEVTAFTADDSHAHDDQVDCMLDAIEKLLINPIPAASYANDAMKEIRLSSPIN